MNVAPARKVRPCVLDAWIVLSWLKDQKPGAQLMEDLLRDAARGKVRLMMSVINLGEVFYITARARDLETADLVLEQLKSLPIEIRPATNPVVIEAARLKAKYPISYADAFAAATAAAEKAPLVTGDAEFRALSQDGIVTLRWAGVK